MISHDYQFSKPQISEGDLLNFKQNIKKIVLKNKIKRICEEFNIDAIKKNIDSERLLYNLDRMASGKKEKKFGGTYDKNLENYSNLFMIARELKVKHCFCEPSINEQIELGIPKNDIGEGKKEYFHVREIFWLNKLKKCKDGNVLFVCGSDHEKTFKSLLENHGYVVEIVGKHISK